MTTQFSELRKWLEREIQNEARTAEDVNRSETMQLLAMSKVTAYTRVIRKMNDIESAKATESNGPPITRPLRGCGGE
jgi:hypothetical protein